MRTPWEAARRLGGYFVSIWKDVHFYGGGPRSHTLLSALSDDEWAQLEVGRITWLSRRQRNHPRPSSFYDHLLTDENGQEVPFRESGNVIDAVRKEPCRTEQLVTEAPFDAVWEWWNILAPETKSPEQYEAPEGSVKRIFYGRRAYCLGRGILTHSGRISDPDLGTPPPPLKKAVW